MDNTRGSLYMILSMGAFTLEDMFIRMASQSLPLGEILLLFGLGGTVVFITLTLSRGESLFHPAILSKPIILRMCSEVLGRLMFISALIVIPFSMSSAILQATPLVVVGGAAVLFGEKVGWRRWSAILLGFIGVLMVIQPGLDGFEPMSLVALIGMLGLAGRDLATRAASSELSGMQLSTYGFSALIPVGTFLLLYNGGAKVPDAQSLLYIGAIITCGCVAYFSLTMAMRTGEVSVVTPFRYSRMVFALIVAMLMFGEKPDWLTLTGITIIVGGGIYTLLRSRKVNQAANPARNT